MSSPKKRKHKCVSLEDKLGALKRLDNGESITRVANSMKVGQVTVGDWKRNRAELERWCSKITWSKGLAERRAMKRSHLHQLDDALFDWFTQQREKRAPLSGPIIQARALTMNNLMGDAKDESFTASSGWLVRWKKRHGLKKLQARDEKPSADCDAVVCGKEEFQELNEDDVMGATEDESLTMLSYAHQFDGSENMHRVRQLETCDETPAGDYESFDIDCVKEEFLVHYKDNATDASRDESLDRSDRKKCGVGQFQTRDENLLAADHEPVVRVKEELCEHDVDKDNNLDDIGFNPLGGELIPHADGVAAFEAALRYAEQQSEVTPDDLLLLKRWRDIAVRKSTETIKQEKIS